MNKQFLEKLLDESNLLIIIPAIFIVASLVLFLILGLSDPSTTRVLESKSLVVSQTSYENDYLVEFSNGGYTAQNPYYVSNPYKISPLTGLLMFETNEAKEYKVIVKGKTTENDLEYYTGSLISHIIPIYGLYPGIVNTVELYEFDGIASYRLVHTEYIKTEELPSNIVLPTLIDTSFEYFGNDLMVTLSNNSSMPVGYDINGDVRWYLNKELSWGPNLLNNGNLIFGDRDLVGYYYSADLIEVDYLGKVYNQYNVPYGYHHEVTELPSGNLIVATNDFLGTIEDKLIEIDRLTGEIVKTINIDDYINTLDGSSEMSTLVDWFKINSVFYDKKTDSLLISGKNKDIVISIDYESLELNWVLGDPLKWDKQFVDEYFLSKVGSGFEWQYGQSDIEVLSNGDILIFDNGINKSKLRAFYVLRNSTYSRAVTYRVDNNLMTIEQISEYGKDFGPSFYSPEYSNVHAYGLSNYLIHSGENTIINDRLNLLPGYELTKDDTFEQLSTTLEIKDGKEVYRMELVDSTYKALKINLYKNTKNYSPKEGNVLGEYIETPEYTGKVNTKYNLLDTVSDKYNLSFVKEFDRLAVDGNFSLGQDVYLILEGNYETRTYQIPTSKNSFTISCIDFYDEESLKLTYFINEEEVSGRYNILIVIDGKEYNTYKNVVFD